MKILLVDQPLWNRGDESAHRGLMRAICKAMPDVEITVLHSNLEPGVVDEFDVHLPQVRYAEVKGSVKGRCRVMTAAMWWNMPWLSFLHPSIRREIPYYREADLVMCAPGGINMGGFFDYGHLFKLKLATWMKKPLVYYGRSIGPFSTDTKRQAAFTRVSWQILHDTSFLCLRDKQSQEWARRLGVECVPTVDSAFLDSPRVAIPKEITDAIGDSKYIVYVPNALNWHFAYRSITDEQIMDYFCRMADIMLERHPDYKLVMLPQTYAQRKNDVDFFRLLAARKQDSRIVVVDDTYSSDIQQTIIAGAQLMVGARYHSIVFAINNNTPFISLSYEHKMSGLLESLDIKGCMLDITKAFASPEATEQSLKTFAQLVDNVVHFPEAQQKAKAIARECFDKFIDYLRNSRKS